MFISTREKKKTHRSLWVRLVCHKKRVEYEVTGICFYTCKNKQNEYTKVRIRE